MSKTFTSKTNGLELHIPADMGAAVRFFSVGEDARKVIDDGSTATRLDDPDQLRSELARAQARVAALEAKEAEQVAKIAPAQGEARSAKGGKKAAAAVQVEVPETEDELG